MQGSPYIFALMDKDFRFWKPQGISATVNAQPYFLDFAPDGWDDIAIQNIRNKKYWGIDRSVSIGLNYVQDGAQILKHVFYNKGAEEPIYLVIAKQELDYTPGVEYGYWYKQIYRGQVDLSTFSHAGSKVTCTTLEDGLPKFLKANENTTYEYPMDVPDAINVKMDGINLRSKKLFGTVNEIPQVTIAGLTPSQTSFYPITQIHVQAEGDNVNLNGQDVVISELSSIDYTTSDQWFLEAVADTTLIVAITNWELRYAAVLSGSQSSYAILAIHKSDGSTVHTIYSNSVSSAIVDNVTIDETFNITLLAGEKLFLVLELHVEKTLLSPPLATATFTISETNIAFSYKNKYKSTYIKAFRPQYLLTKIVNDMTESNYSAAVANYFSPSVHSNKVFTPGNAIRGLSDAVLKISFSDFFQFWDCFDSVGLSVTAGKVNIDRKQNLIDTLNIIDLPEPSNLKVTLAKDYAYNELEIGYPEIKNDIGVLNGNEEFNCKYLFSIGATNSPVKLNKVSKIKASCYEIEKIRVTTAGKDTTDNKADNDVFVIHINNTLIAGSGAIPDHYELDRSLNSTATGLLEPDTVFNIIFSPKRMIKNNGPFLRSSLYLCDGKILAYKTADKNNKLVCDGITEKADENIGGLGDKFFLPVLLSGDIPVPDDILSLLDTNPLQIVRFPFYGTYYKGILVNLGIAPSSNKEQAFQLLSTTDNVLKNLVEYYG